MPSACDPDACTRVSAVMRDVLQRVQPVRVAVLCVLAGTAAFKPAGAQSSPNARFAAEVGATLGTTWAEGVGAPTVRSSASPVLAIRAGWQTSANWRTVVAARTSTGSVALREGGDHWNGGSLTLTDIVGGFAFRSHAGAWSRLAGEAGIGVSYLAGPANVAPFQDASTLVPMLDANVALELPQHFTAQPVSLVLRGSWLRLGGEANDAAVATAGTVRRFSLTVRIGR